MLSHIRKMSEEFGMSPNALLFRLALIGALILALAGSLAFAAGWFDPGKVSPAGIVGAFEHANGIHPGFRRNHAKGVCLAGDFEGNGNGVRLSKAAVFLRGHIPVTGRFAFAGGQPFMADSQKAVRSMALLFKLNHGEEWRTGMNNIPVFSVNTPEAFYQQILASAPDPKTGKPDPAKLKAFFDQHPEALRARAINSAVPFSSGFENSSFNSLDAFLFINQAGVETPVRWSMVPTQINKVAQAGSKPGSGSSNYLFDELIDAVAHYPLQWHLVVTVGLAGDATNDATVPWPDSREKVDVGTLTVYQVDAEDSGNCRDINFDPLVLPAGIAKSDDPLLIARSAAYSQSFTRRAGESKQPSAVNSTDFRVVK